MIFDKWQQDIIDHEGNITLRSGRQVGKSTTVGKRITDFMFDYAPCTQLITAPSQRQSSQLFIKTMGWLYARNKEALDAAGGYKEDSSLSVRRNAEHLRNFEKKHGIFATYPTKTEVHLKNGSICYALPAGKTGAYLRTFTLDFLHIDEAAYVPDMVYNALRPMLAVSMKKKGLGWESLLSTPFGKGGFFYESHQSDDYKQFHKSSEDCDRISKVMLLKEKKRLSRVEYAQEWLGEFTDEFRQFFSTALIKKRMANFIRWKYAENFQKGMAYYLGIDVARYGEDENAFIIIEMQKNNNLKIVAVETTENKNLMDTCGKIMKLDEQYHFKKILIDDAGLGAGLTDRLMETVGRRMVGLSNAKKTLDKDGRKGKIFKEDLYSNALVLMEKEPAQIDIINNLKLLRSLRSMTFEYTSEKNLRIYGKYSHLAEAFVRACWCIKEKGLNIFIY